MIGPARRPRYDDGAVTLFHGDALGVLRELPDETVDACVTSPPYFGLRDYQQDGQYGTEESPLGFVVTLRDVFAEVRRVLAPTGTLWLNIGDTYSGRANASPSRDRHSGSSHRAGVVPVDRNTTAYAPYKSLLGVPWRTAFALVDDGWTLRNDVVWHKTNGTPESVRDRLTVRHEYLFLFTKSARYDFDLDAIRVPHTGRPQRRPKGKPGRAVPRPGGQPQQTWSTFQRDEPGHDGHPLGANPGTVWTIPTTPFGHDHHATMPLELAQRCVATMTRRGGHVLDPFSGSGTTGLAAARAGHRYTGIDLSADYLDLSLDTRFLQRDLFEVTA